MKRVYAIIFVLIVAVTVALFLHKDGPTTASFPVELPTDDTQPDNRSQIKSENDAEPAPESETHAQNCIQYPDEELQLLAPQEAAMVEQTRAMGYQVLAYLNIERSTVEDYALQGDSAAMVVLSRIEANAAYGIAGAILTKQERKNASRHFAAVSEEESKAHLREALRWTYLAALHGRLEVLPLYGNGLAASGMDAVKLGWVSQDQYDAFSESEKSALHPRKVYGRLLYDLAPEFVESHQRNSWALTDHTNDELISPIVKLLRQEFFDGLELKQLPIPGTVGTRYPKYLEILNNTCDQPAFSTER